MPKILWSFEFGGPSMSQESANTKLVQAQSPSATAIAKELQLGGGNIEDSTPLHVILDTLYATPLKAPS